MAQGAATGSAGPSRTTGRTPTSDSAAVSAAALAQTAPAARAPAAELVLGSTSASARVEWTWRSVLPEVAPSVRATAARVSALEVEKASESTSAPTG